VLSAAGSIAKVTMMVSFAATPPAGTVTARLEPVVSLELVPMFFTNAAAANAGPAARVAKMVTARATPRGDRRLFSS